jgi:endonuclease YncB( thermonuclease family)
MRGSRRILAVALLLAALPIAADAEQVYRVISVYDGDGLHTREHGRVRFAITAAPEINDLARCKREHDAGIVARDYVRGRTRDGVVLRREPGERDVDPHGRLLRHVYAADGGDIEAELIARGLAVRFRHGAQPHDWCRP